MYHYQGPEFCVCHTGGNADMLDGECVAWHVLEAYPVVTVLDFLTSCIDDTPLSSPFCDSCDRVTDDEAKARSQS